MKTWQTKLIHSDAKVPQGYRSLATPVYRGSTTLFESLADVSDRWDQRAGYTYGLYGTPTNLELAAKVCELESGAHTIVTPGGEAAIALVNLSVLHAGDHLLIPSSLYGPHAHFVHTLLERFGVSASVYDPLAGASTLAGLFNERTRLVWVESPQSITMEVQDVPSIADAAHKNGAIVAMDNTWSGGIFFSALDKGVDISMQALTKYVAGHSDVLLGAVTVRDERLYKQLGASMQVLGMGASPDDCSLALRGMTTMAVRLRAIEASALQIAQWLGEQPEIERVLHPALPSTPGHEFWKRDFTGSSGLFSVVFREETSRSEINRFLEALRLFKFGWSWGGVTSLALPYDRPPYGNRIVRFNIGLESSDDLIADIRAALRSR